MKKIIFTLLLGVGLLFGQYNFRSYTIFDDSLTYSSGNLTLEYELSHDTTAGFGMNYDGDNSVVTISGSMIDTGWVHIDIANNILDYSVAKWTRYKLFSASDTITSEIIKTWNKKGSFLLWIKLTDGTGAKIKVNGIYQGQ